MTRVVVLILIALAFVYLLDGALRRVRRRLERFRDLASGGAGRGAARSERLVACQGCGVHVTESRALRAPGRAGTPGLFCSEACRRRSLAAS